MSGGSRCIQGVLCDGMKGENYWLNGCMKYVEVCLDLPGQYNLNALRRVHELLNLPATEKLSFGIQALEDWAD